MVLCLIIVGVLVFYNYCVHLLTWYQSHSRGGCNVPIFGFPCSVVRGNLTSLCQFDQSSKMRTRVPTIWQSYMGPG